MIVFHCCTLQTFSRELYTESLSVTLLWPCVSKQAAWACMKNPGWACRAVGRAPSVVDLWCESALWVQRSVSGSKRIRRRCCSGVYDIIFLPNTDHWKWPSVSVCMGNICMCDFMREASQPSHARGTGPNNIHKTALCLSAIPRGPACRC